MDIGLKQINIMLKIRKRIEHPLEGTRFYCSPDQDIVYTIYRVSERIDRVSIQWHSPPKGTLTTGTYNLKEVLKLINDKVWVKC